MIKASELRIGKTFIDVDGSFVTPSHLNETSFSFIVTKTKQGEIIYNPYLPFADERVKPIPLTEELLLKCGFDKCNGDYFKLNYDKRKRQLSIKIGFKLEMVSKGISTADADCKYLHQLQNLYFVLTGKELEINL